MHSKFPNLLLVHYDINPPSNWESREILSNIVEFMEWQQKCLPAGKNWDASHSLRTVWSKQNWSSVNYAFPWATKEIFTSWMFVI